MKLRRMLRELVVFAITVLVLLSARSSLADHYQVPSGSMEPTVETGDRIVVNKSAYGLRVPFSHTLAVRFDGPQVGDVVVLDSPEEDKVLLKRVVATPGTTVEVREGHVVLDGVEAPIDAAGYEQLGAAHHKVSLARGGGPDYGPLTLPADKYLVMGDNRGDSRDGRYFGLVDRTAILGRAAAVYWRSGFTWDGL